MYGFTSLKFMQIRMGGMVCFPRRSVESNVFIYLHHTMFSLSRIPLMNVLAYCRETFFSDLPEEEAAYYLAHSSGVNLPSFNPRTSLCLGIKYYTPSKTSLDPPMLRRSGEFPEDTIFLAATCRVIAIALSEEDPIVTRDHLLNKV